MATKHDGTMADLFDHYEKRMSKAKTNAEKVRALTDQIRETCGRDDLSDRSRMNQLAWLAGVATAHLRRYAGHLERGEVE